MFCWIRTACLWIQMTVAINGRGMTSESSESKQESNHEFNFFIDRQLQNNLLQADDDLLAEKESGDKYIARNNIKSGKSTKTDLKVDKFGDFTGWFPDQKLVCRKLDGAKSDQKPRESTFIHPWKDYKKAKEENYAFKHYTDTRKYIEQYRKEHCRQSQNNRFSSGGTDRERRYAYPNHTSQPPPVQVQVQALWKGLPVSAAENPALHYSNRKDSLGTLVAPTPTQNSNCSCSRQNHSHQPDLTSQAHRYKLVPSPFTRTNAADLRSQHGDSDNSSESGDSRTKTPRPRINSAASVTGRAIMKSPTKISVPAQGVHNGVRPYPIQALTIQQTSIKSGSDPGPPPSSSPKPLDNLNVVAPEKQKTLIVERKEVEPIVPTLQAHSLNNLLSSNEAPLRGYALSPRSRPNDVISIQAAENHNLSADSDTDGDTFCSSDAVSIERLSTCPLSADVRVKHKIDIQTSQMLQMFLNDPVLSKLNQRPSLNGARSVAETTHFINQNILPQNDTDAVGRVNMWNPIVSAPKARLSSGNSHQELRNSMRQKPFRKPSLEQNVGANSTFGKTVKIIHDMHERGRYTGNVLEKKDYFHPVKKIKLSITRLDNAVSFCRAQIETKDNAPLRKTSSAKASDSSSDKFTRSTHKSEHTDGNGIEINLAKGRIYEIPRRRPSIKGTENAETTIHSTAKIISDSDGTNAMPNIGEVKANKNLNDIIKHVIMDGDKTDEVNSSRPSTVKHVSFSDKEPDVVFTNTCPKIKHVCSSDKRTDQPDEIILERQIKETLLNEKAPDQTVNKLFECPAILDPQHKTAEMQTLRNKILEFNQENLQGNDADTVVARSASFELDKKGFKGKMFENPAYIGDSISRKNLYSRDNNLNKSPVTGESKAGIDMREIKSKTYSESQEHKSDFDPITKDSMSHTAFGVADLKSGLNLPRPTFGIPSPRNKNGDGNHNVKGKKAVAEKNSENVCSTISLQNQQSGEAQHWRLNSRKPLNGEDENEDYSESIVQLDVKTNILKGTKIGTGNETLRDQVHVVSSLEVQSPRSSKGSHSGNVKRKVKKTALASGKRLHDHPDLEGLTWAEKLEFLRSVNKRPEKRKPKPQKLRYVKDEPEPLPTSEHEQLYEQRRIKHLVEQARMKGGKQFDWVNEAKVKVKSVDRASGKVKPAANPSPVYDDSDHSSIGSACDEEFEDERKFGKYGIYVPQKGAPKKLFDCHNIARSNTCMFSS